VILAKPSGDPGSNAIDTFSQQGPPSGPFCFFGRLA
jgi:hypothetical protein